MTEYKTVRLGERSELLPGGQYREYMRGEIMVDGLGPFVVEVEKKDGWQHEWKQKADEQVRNVRSVTS